MTVRLNTEKLKEKSDHIATLYACVERLEIAIAEYNAAIEARWVELTKCAKPYNDAVMSAKQWVEQTGYDALLSGLLETVEFERPEEINFYVEYPADVMEGLPDEA
jgi:hypothetical protein